MNWFYCMFRKWLTENRCHSNFIALFYTIFDEEKLVLERRRMKTHRHSIFSLKWWISLCFIDYFCGWNSLAWHLFMFFSIFLPHIFFIPSNRSCSRSCKAKSCWRSDRCCWSRRRRWNSPHTRKEIQGGRSCTWKWCRRRSGCLNWLTNQTTNTHIYTHTTTNNKNNNKIYI